MSSLAETKKKLETLERRAAKRAASEKAAKERELRQLRKKIDGNKEREYKWLKRNPTKKETKKEEPQEEKNPFIELLDPGYYDKQKEKPKQVEKPKPIPVQKPAPAPKPKPKPLPKPKPKKAPRSHKKVRSILKHIGGIKLKTIARAAATVAIPIVAVFAGKKAFDKAPERYDDSNNNKGIAVAATPKAPAEKERTYDASNDFVKAPQTKTLGESVDKPASPTSKKLDAGTTGVTVAKPVVREILLDDKTPQGGRVIIASNALENSLEQTFMGKNVSEQTTQTLKDICAGFRINNNSVLKCKLILGKDNEVSYFSFSCKEGKREKSYEAFGIGGSFYDKEGNDLSTLIDYDPLHGKGGSEPSSLYRTPHRPNHKGIDWAAPRGTKIYAAHDGTIVYSRFSYPNDGLGGYGYAVLLQDTHGKYITLYGHCDKLHVKPGQQVKKGELVGDVGNSGTWMGVTGLHLHFGVYKTNGTDFVAMLPKVGPEAMDGRVISKAFYHSKVASINPKNFNYSHKLEGSNLKILANHIAYTRDYMKKNEKDSNSYAIATATSIARGR